MKNLVVTFLCVLLFCSCSYENEGEASVRMAMINGAIYRDSGEVSEMTPRCGTYDGEVVKNVEEGEVPIEEHTSNFGNCGYQNTTPTSKEFHIGNDWVIFERDTITLADFVGVKREDAGQVKLHYSPEIIEVDVDEFYDIAEKITLVNIENKPMQKTADGVNFEFPKGIYITVNGFDGYAFVSDDCTADRCGMHMSRLPIADYGIEKKDLKLIKNLFNK